MALSRRTGQRFQGAIWPGFVDAMTGLLLVLMFVLTIFMVVQFVLRETISGQENQLDALSTEISALADALGLERQRSADLTTEMGALNATLDDAREQARQQMALIASLTAERDAQAGRIASFEEQVASLLAQRDRALGNVAALEGEKQTLIDEREALQLALAQARTEIDAGAEAARLAAAKREALEALIADLKTEQALTENARLALDTRVSELEAQLTEAEKTRLAEAAAAQALRDRLANADTELTAMTLALEAQRKKAEDTLTLLAAAEAAGKDLSDKLAKALAAKLAAENAADQQLTDAERQAALLAIANKALSDEQAVSAEAQRQQALLNQQVAALRTQLGSLQSLLDDYKDRDAAARVQLETLGSDLNAALARAASEERKRRQLEEAERLRLEAEKKALEAEKQDLEKYKSDFFGRLRDVLSGQEGVRIVGDRFVFSSEVLFELGSADLSPEGQGEIAKIARILRSIAGDIPPEIDWVIRVDGHTDNVPLSPGADYADNWELSQARALSVVRYMVNFLGLPPDRLSANGFGEYQPINTANTPQARAQNRRIELKLTEK